MKKKIIAFLLFILLSASLLMTTGCSSDYIMTAKGEKLNAGYYSFYIHWQRDYYKEYLKNNGYDITTSMDEYYTENMTLRETIISTAKTQYLSFVVVSEKFEELGLSLTEEQQANIESLYHDEWLKTYGEAGMKNILKTLGLKKNEFMNLLSIQTKSEALLDYYYGENGQTPITEQDKRDYFAKNYVRFKYVLLSTVDSENKLLPPEEISNKRALANDILTKVENGNSFEDLIKDYSEDYNKIADNMTAEDKASAEKSNQSAITDGLISDLNGVFNQTLYTYYNINVNTNIVNKLVEMNVGDSAIVEIDNSIWVIKKYDLNEDPAYFSDREKSIYEALYANDFSARYTRWLAEMEYSFNDAMIKELDPGKFSDLFSDVYDMKNEASSDQNKK